METEKVKPVSTAPAAPTEIPTKCVTSRIKTQVNCKVKFIDFEGRSDGESIKRILGCCLMLFIKKMIVFGAIFGQTHFLDVVPRAKYFDGKVMDNFFQRNVHTRLFCIKVRSEEKRFSSIPLLDSLSP